MPCLRQLPRWAWFGTGVLAFIAGLVNAAGYLGFRHESISNMTGNTSLLGIALGTAGACGLGYGVYRQYSLARGIPVT